MTPRQPQKQVFEPNILIDPAELRSESSVERLEKANKYLKEMAYKKVGGTHAREERECPSVVCVLGYFMSGHTQKNRCKYSSRYAAVPSRFSCFFPLQSFLPFQRFTEGYRLVAGHGDGN